ncbi:hypothetical protein BDF14DRAFT_545316 [Spinellus fusiger]|nr:hypothetical protein BDF14DRAFT_545316 [Spinellus fusiger]
MDKVPRFTVSLISLSSNIILVLADNANGKTPEWKQDATGTYYEYSIDYKIPETQPGSYTVVLLDPATQLQLSIPIVVSPKAHAFIATVASVNTVAADNTVASLTTVGTINATNTHGPKSSSLLGDNNAGAIISPGLATKTLFALAGVAGVAFML